MPAAPRGEDLVKVSGAVLEAYRGALVDMQAWDRVAPHLSPEARALLEKPPIALVMVDSWLVDPIIETIERQLGVDAVVEVGARAVRKGLMKFLGPMIRGTSELFGATPASLLARLDRISGLNVKGVGMRWESTSATSGTLRLEYPRATPSANFHIWRGSVSVVFDLCNTVGEVSAPVPNAANTQCTLSLRWNL
jgi:hypothetical protein